MSTCDKDMPLSLNKYIWHVNMWQGYVIVNKKSVYDMLTCDKDMPLSLNKYIWHVNMWQVYVIVTK
jgi:hypothetical protein